jgi:phenylacetate-CoA ligase
MMPESLLWLLRDTRSARKHGLAAVMRRQRARLADMVAFARTNSPYYREFYQHVPARIEDPTLLPVTDKQKLMARFDDWATDRRVTLDRSRGFVDNPDLIGERFLGVYTLVTTSGTTGTHGIFLVDDRTLSVTNALAVRMLSAWLTFGDVIRLLLGGGRLTMVNAMGGHFASAVAATRLHRRRGKRLQVVPVDLPLPEMVARLNQFRPAILASYASMAALLAGEQEAGHLRIDPVLVVLSAEGLVAGEYKRISRAFKTIVRDSYAATECPFLSYRCEHGWLHVNSDWVVVEPVDADYQPTSPGEQSHTVLISNLANRIQPILRYDLGDSVLQRPDPCPCGDPLPAIRVQGRAADVLTFPGTRGELVRLPPLVFGTLVDRIPAVELFQIVQTAPTTIRVRLLPTVGTNPDRVWQVLQRNLMRLLSEHNLNHVMIERAEEPPAQSAGGKHRTVVPLR